VFSGGAGPSFNGVDGRAGAEVVRGPVYSIFSQQPAHAKISAIGAVQRAIIE
jgi:hypothetical protein